MILLRQAMRSIWRGRRAYTACIVLMAIGIAVYVSFNLMFRNLSAAMSGMYADQRFGDGFARVTAIPQSAVEQARAVEGIQQLDATIVTDARFQKENSERIITLRLSSFDPGQPDRLNNFVLVKGTLPGDDGVLVSDTFAAANGLAVGDALPLIIEGKKTAPVISGLVQSPEYVYAIPDAGQIMPDAEAFGFGYLPLSRMETLSGKAGLANTLSFLLEENATFTQVKYRLEDALRPYGIRMLVERKDQPSHAMLDQEVASIGAMSGSLPMMFIMISVIILYIMLKRIIEQERSQIGTLKAFGFADRTILAHYLGYGGVTGLVGGGLGVLLGLLLADSMTDIYLVYFSLPAMSAPPAPEFLAQGFAIAVGAGLLGAFMGTRGMLKLSPSEAMRPPSPPAVRGDLVGRLPLLRRLLSSYGYMAARNITRNKFRSAFVVLGVAFSFSLTAFMASFGEMFDILLFNQFTEVEVYNLKISLNQPTAYRAALEDTLALDDVREAEGMLELPVEARHRNLRKDLSITAIQPDSALYHIYDNDTGEAHPTPSGGVIISSRLAEDLLLKRGDTLTIRTAYTGDEDLPLPVLGVIGSNLGSTIYISTEDLWAVLDVPPAVNGVLVRSQETGSIKSALLEAQNVAAITDQAEAMQIYTDMFETYAVLLYMMRLAGAVVAFAIISNTASISLSERKREYATMRVLGMHPGEIGQVVGFEYWLLLLAAIPPGIALTRVIKVAMAGMIDNDMFSIPLYTAPSSFLQAALLCMVAVVLSNRMARRKIARFDMVEVLKERE